MCKTIGFARRLVVGFTLIELLIVVAIISILSSIAVPNFLEAQTRAKVSRAKADMAAVATAVEVYAIDHNTYPYRRHPLWQSGLSYYVPLLKTKVEDLKVLTSPIPYMTTLPGDVFEQVVKPPLNIIDYFDPVQTRLTAWSIQGGGEPPDVSLWMLVSVGPDGYIGVSSTGKPGEYPPQGIYSSTYINEYNPINGTISAGNIYRLQGNASFTKVVRGD